MNNSNQRPSRCGGSGVGYEGDIKCTKKECDFYIGHYAKTLRACGAGIYQCCGFRKK